MSKTKEENPQPATTSAAPGAGAQEPVHVIVDLTKTHVAYANFCRVTGTPEELIVDFGLNSELASVPTMPIEISQRIVLNYYTAKRLLGALYTSVQRHEAAFGSLEVDVQKRVLSSAQQPG